MPRPTEVEAATGEHCEPTFASARLDLILPFDTTYETEAEWVRLGPLSKPLDPEREAVGPQVRKHLTRSIAIDLTVVNERDLPTHLGQVFLPRA